jgi:hypothetical protein
MVEGVDRKLTLGGDRSGDANLRSKHLFVFFPQEMASITNEPLNSCDAL